MSENVMCRLGFVRGFVCSESIADITTTTIQRHRRHDHEDDDNDSTTSHAQRHGLDDVDRRTGKTSPYVVSPEALKFKSESKEIRQANRQRPLDVPFPVATDVSTDSFLIGAPADEGSLVPSFLKVAPVGSNRAQRNMAMDPRQNPSNEPESIAVSDPRSLSRGAVRPIPDVFQQCSLTQALAGQLSREDRGTLET